MKVALRKDLGAIAFSLQELIKEYIQFMLGQHIHLLNAFTGYVFKSLKSLSKIYLGSRFGLEMEGM